MATSPQKPWTYDVPPDLRADLESALRSRYHGPAELWAVFIEWMNKHGVEQPADATIYPAKENDAPLHRQ